MKCFAEPEGVEADFAPAHEARLASEALRNRIQNFFTRFEAQHRLPKGAAERLQLGGYRA